LGEGFQFVPVGEVEFGDGGVWGEGCGIEDPSHGHEILETVEVGRAEFLSPEVAEATIPEEGEGEFFLEEAFWG